MAFYKACSLYWARLGCKAKLANVHTGRNQNLKPDLLVEPAFGLPLPLAAFLYKFGVFVGNLLFALQSFSIYRFLALGWLDYFE